MSTLKVNNIQTTSGGSNSTPEQIEQGRAKAWLNLNCSGTAALRDSFNVSSITDNATGDFTVTFANAMANTNYAPVASCSRVVLNIDGSDFNLRVFAFPFVTSSGSTVNATTSAFRINFTTSTLDGNSQDPDHALVAVFGD
tara:strand:+ start:29 stop:451 length:423 start_codon:yes stop_codon:yes gene_type:complete